MFELGVHLLRLLEAVVASGSSIFANTAKGKVNCIRVIQVLVHLLGRVLSSEVYGTVLASEWMISSVERVHMIW